MKKKIRTPFEMLRDSFDNTLNIEQKTKVLYDTFGKHYEEGNNSFSLDVDASDSDGSVSVSTSTIIGEKDVVLLEVGGILVDKDGSQAVLLNKDDCMKLIRALSTAASLLR